MLFFVLPFAYFVKTRLPGIISVISWIISTVLPGLFLYSYYNLTLDIYSLLSLLISFLLFGIVYENGYIQNDLITTKFESSPTIRLNQSEQEIGTANIKIIFLTRFLVAAAILILAYFFIFSFQFLFQLTATLLLLQILFYYYNSVRSRLNLFLIMPLSFLRLFGWVIPFIPGGDLLAFIPFSFLLYPFCKFLELSTLPRYRFELLSCVIGDIDKFRIKYYSFLVVFFVFFVILWPSSEIYLFLSVYFLFFRILTYVLLKNSAYFKLNMKNKFKNQKK